MMPYTHLSRTDYTSLNWIIVMARRDPPPPRSQIVFLTRGCTVAIGVFWVVSMVHYLHDMTIGCRGDRTLLWIAFFRYWKYWYCCVLSIESVLRTAQYVAIIPRTYTCVCCYRILCSIYCWLFSYWYAHWSFWHSKCDNLFFFDARK